MSSKATDGQAMQLLRADRPPCLAAVLRRRDTPSLTSVADSSSSREEGYSAFRSLVERNSDCVWNPSLVAGVCGLQFRGSLARPLVVLAGGSDFSLEVVRSAWARRVLRPPRGYDILCLGDICELAMKPVPQTQFAPLSEALCKAVADLNEENIMATAAAIASELGKSFPHQVEVPDEGLLHKTLGALIKERKLYHNGKGYFVVGPDTYCRRRGPSTVGERQMVMMTKEEAVVVPVHSSSSSHDQKKRARRRRRSSAVQVSESDLVAAAASSSSSSSPTSSPPPWRVTVERSRSLRVLRMNKRGKMPLFHRHQSLRSNATPSEPDDVRKCEKQSVFTKLFQRMQSLSEKSHKHVTFSSQFPSVEWLKTTTVQQQHIASHSVATQTSASSLRWHKAMSKVEERESSDSTSKQLSFNHPTSNSAFTKLFSTNISESQKWMERKNKQSSPIGENNKSPTPQRYSYGAYVSHCKRHPFALRNSLSNGSPSSAKDELAKSSNLCQPNNTAVANARSGNGSAEGEASSTISCRPPSVSHVGSFDVSIPAHVCDANNQNVSSNVCRRSPKCPNKKKTKNRMSLFCETTTENASSTRDETEPPTSVTNDSVVSSEKNPSGLQIGGDKGRVTSENGMLGFASSYLKRNPDSSSPTKASPKIEPTPNSPEVDQKESRKASGGKSSVSKEIVIDNSVNVEVVVDRPPLLKGGNLATTVNQTVTEETIVSKGNSKVVTVTNIVTSLTQAASGVSAENSKRAFVKPSPVNSPKS